MGAYRVTLVFCMCKWCMVVISYMGRCVTVVTYVCELFVAVVSYTYGCAMVVSYICGRLTVVSCLHG